jgi:hypothetical protein
MYADHKHGPFGHYERKSTGHVLNALCRIGVPLHIVEMVMFAGPDVSGVLNPEMKNVPKPMYPARLKYGNETFGHYAYFDGLDEPVFNFEKLNIPSIVAEVAEGGAKKYLLRPSLSFTSVLVLQSRDKEVVDMMTGVLDEIYREREDAESYKTRVKALVVWNGQLLRSSDPELVLEIWRPDQAKDFLSYLQKRINER